MRILVTAPTAFEIAPFMEKFPDTDFLITGVGAPIAIYHLTKKIHNSNYDIVIQAGVAGSFSQHIGLSEVIKVGSDCFADLGVFEKNSFSSVFDLSLADINHFPFQSGHLVNEDVDRFFPTIKTVNAITVNSLTDDHARISLLQNKYHASVETMEGAALHFVCLHEKIPFVQLRAISNYVGERDKAKWKLSEAINHLNDILIDVITSLR